MSNFLPALLIVVVLCDVRLNVVMLNVVMLIVVMLNVVMLSVVEPAELLAYHAKVRLGCKCRSSI
jgi:hypothetical protein